MESQTDHLYHVLLTVIDYHKEPSGTQPSTYVIDTCGSLNRAKNSSYRILPMLRYKVEDFAEFALHSGPRGSHKHGDRVLVYAKALSGRVFVVSILVTPNNLQLRMGCDGSIVLPSGTSSLQYVIQTTVDYSKHRAGTEQETQIEGVFIHPNEAFAAAQNILNPLDFADFRTPERLDGKWPHGEEVVSYAVSDTGLNIFIILTTTTDLERIYQG